MGRSGKIEIKTQRCHQLVYAGVEAAAVLEELLPYLFLKKEQARIAIRFQKMIRHGRSRPLSLREQQARFQCWKKVKELKR